MAKIDKDGVIRGKIGDLVYRNYRGQQIIQRVADKTKKSEKVKKNNTEFGYASGKESTLRKFYVDTLKLYNDGNLHNRHRKILYELLIHNMAKKAEERYLSDGNPKQYIGLEFNVNSPWENFMPYYIPIKETEKSITLEIPSLYSELFYKKIKDKKIDHLKLSFNIISMDPDLLQEHSLILLNQREMVLYQNQKIETFNWEISNLPPNRFILVVGKIEYFEMNSIYGLRTINSKELCPSCILYASKFIS